MSCMEGMEETGGRRHEGKCSSFFPDDIKELLEELACECVVLTFRNGTKEKVTIECVSDELLVVRDQNMYRFIDIDCICSVCVSADTILDSLLGSCK